MTAPRILVVGGGAGGLPLVTFLGKRLGRKQLADVVLIDSNTNHVWKPRYHEVATGAIDADLDAVDFRAHARLNHYRFVPGALTAVDTAARSVTLAAVVGANGQTVLPERTMDYDYLVLALGSQSNDFNTPGVREHAMFMDSRRQAERFRERFLNACMQADFENRPLSIAIVGGGATGVELAAELHHAVSMLKLYGHEHLDRRRLNVHLIEATSRLLPALPEKVSSSARSHLERLGVKVHTDTLVECAEAGAFVVKGGERIEGDLLVWAAGVKAPDVLSSLQGFSFNRIGQIDVEPTLQARGHEQVYVIGDSASCILPGSERPLPPRAQTAQQMAHHLAKSLEGVVLRGRTPTPFVYRDRGSLVSLSKYSSVGTLIPTAKGSNLFIEGALARWAYISLYRMHQAALYGWPRTVMLLIAGRFNRLVRPRLKLH
ncbi:NAD(P)/FAD-dependent oxidoreductase [Isoalcanivorax beigongshangi]|uniref:NAD(P)/FAD-dependent oxidoreductase n=1 Tax=Isoalcanivorax beigongshangi TaxID=3238810 RepID=A0ABV4AE52_9GAMM